MAKSTKRMAAIGIILFASMIMTIIGACDTFAASIIPTASNNINVSGVSNSGIARTANGFVRVFCDSEKVYAEDYDDSFNITSRRIIPMELNMYGGFYSGSNAYYLVFGQLNEKEDDNAEVIRVVKYDKNWNRISVAKLKGDSEFAHEVRIPFDAGNLNMAEYDGMLYIVTGHEGYVDDQYGQGHQGFLMYKVNESTMQGEIVDADLWHSFAQHIAIKDQNNIYTVEESEGSRFTKLTKRTTSDYNGSSISVLDYGGSRTSAWAIPTYASVDGIALSDSNVLTIGSSIDQSRYEDESYSKEYRVYLTKTPMNNFSKEATSFKWLTTKNIQGGFSGIKITRVNSSRFMISWSESNEKGTAENGRYNGLETRVLHYIFVDGDGNKISKEYTVSGCISECDPVIKNGKAVFYSSDNGSVVFYSIDTNTGKVSKKEYLIAGPAAAWEFKDGTLTVKGTGDIRENFADGSLSLVENRLQKIIVKNGIKKISDWAFANLEKCKEVVLENGVTEIGDGAFYGIYGLEKITIPSSVKKIADNAFDTGYYWLGDGSPVINVTIYCEKGSYAEQYAKRLGIEYVTPEKSKKQKNVSGKNGANKSSDKAVRLNEKAALKAAGSDMDPAGSSFAPLMLKAKKATARVVKLAWKKAPNAVSYEIYGNKIGKKNKMIKLGKSKGKSFIVRKINKKLKKKTYYKFLVIAFDKKGNAVSLSKVIYDATKGSVKAANPKGVNVKSCISKTGKKLKQYKTTAQIKLKAGKKTKLKASIIKSKKERIKKCAGIRFDSSNKKLATVNSKGVVKAIEKGHCNIYAYAQNGAVKTIKVIVK